jgi:hypothetical protein
MMVIVMNVTAVKKINDWKIARFVTPTAFTSAGQPIQGGKTIVNFYSSLDEIEIYSTDENGDIIDPAKFVPVHDTSAWNSLVESYEQHAAAGTFQRYILA